MEQHSYTHPILRSDSIDPLVEPILGPSQRFGIEAWTVGDGSVRGIIWIDGQEGPSVSAHSFADLEDAADVSGRYRQVTGWQDTGHETAILEYLRCDSE